MKRKANIKAVFAALLFALLICLPAAEARPKLVWMPLKYGFFKRNTPVKFLILHSTETGRPADAKTVIKSWNNSKLHVGAHFVVDRNGTIYQCVNPDMAASHVDSSKTLFGVRNSNSIGVEIVRSGKQKYTQQQLAAVTKLSLYLQDRYGIPDRNVLGHGKVQPSDRRDPVAFNWQAFATSRTALRVETASSRLAAVSPGTRLPQEKTSSGQG